MFNILHIFLVDLHPLLTVYLSQSLSKTRKQIGWVVGGVYKNMLRRQFFFYFIGLINENLQNCSATLKAQASKRSDTRKCLVVRARWLYKL